MSFSPSNKFNGTIDKFEAVFSRNVTSFTNSLADGVDRILLGMPDSAERDKAIRKLMSKYAPSPVIGFDWSIINAVDFDFEGFSGKHLTAYSILNQHPDIPSSSVQFPSLLVLHHMSLASKLAYEDPSIIMHVCKNWNMHINENLIFWFKDFRAYIMYDDNNIVLSFRGTEIINPKDWSTDLKLKFVPMASLILNEAGEQVIEEILDGASSAIESLVHFGFYNALGLTNTYKGASPFSKLREVLHQMHQANPQKKIWINGHSLGGALASVFVAQLVLRNDILLSHLGGLYTFGQPRCGNNDFANLFNDLIERGLVYRTVNKRDLVCKLPMQVTKYLHHGGKVSISRAKLVLPCKGQFVELAPLVTYKELQPNSTMKKVMFALLPGMVEDHYPSEYVRNVKLFVKNHL